MEQAHSSEWTAEAGVSGIKSLCSTSHMPSCMWDIRVGLKTKLTSHPKQPCVSGEWALYPSTLECSWLTAMIPLGNRHQRGRTLTGASGWGPAYPSVGVSDLFFCRLVSFWSCVGGHYEPLPVLIFYSSSHINVHCVLWHTSLRPRYLTNKTCNKHRKLH